MQKLAPALVVLLASCVGPPQRVHNPGPEIVAALEVMYADLSFRRWDALGDHFLPDAALVFSTPTGPKRMTPPEFIDMVRKKVEGKDVFQEEMLEATVRTHGNMASVWSRFEGREGNGTEIRTWSGVDAFTLVKLEGRWRIALIAVSQDPKEEKK